MRRLIDADALHDAIVRRVIDEPRHTQGERMGARMAASLVREFAERTRTQFEWVVTVEGEQDPREWWIVAAPTADEAITRVENQYSTKQRISHDRICATRLDAIRRLEP